MRGMLRCHVVLGLVLIIAVSPSFSVESDAPATGSSKHLQVRRDTHGPKALKVLFIGNSYTGGIRGTVNALVEASPYAQSTLEYAVKGGRTLKQHLNDSKTLARIKSTKWDYVVLQEQSQTPTLPGRYDDFCDAVMALSEMIRQQGAKPVLYMTWGRRDKDKQNPQINPDYETMQMRLTRAYTDAAKQADALIAPVGEAWRVVRRERPQLGIQLYRDDGSHPSQKGAFLAACVFYAMLFDADPTELDFNGSLPAAEAAYLKNKAKIPTGHTSAADSASHADNAVWPQFRGPDGLGIAVDSKAYPAELDTAGNLLWKTPVPKGYSSPCIWGDRIFITAHSGKTLETLCVDRQDGRIRWRRSVEAETMEKISNSNSHASPTPTCDGKRVYVYFGSFGLLAYDLDGKVLWQKPLPLPEMMHGSASSPLLTGERVIINCDQKNDPYLLALDCVTGAQVWKRDRPATKLMFNWATPVLWKQGDKKELVVLGRRKLIAYDPQDGKERWWVEGLPMETASTPVFTEKTLYAAATTAFTGDPVNPIEIPDYQEVLDQYDSNGDKQLVQAEIPDDFALVYRLGTLSFSGVKKSFPGLDADLNGILSEKEWKEATGKVSLMQARRKDAFFAVSEGGEGNVTASHVQWTVHEGVGQVASPLVYEGRAYLVKHGGNLTCFNAATGERVYSEKLGHRVYYYASPVVANGNLYICSYMGRVFVVQAGDTFKVLTENRIGERIRATPALVDGKVYLRTDKHLMAFGR